MPIRVGCPSCGAVLNASDAAAGKIVNCPKCKSKMQLPAAKPAADDDFEVVDDAPKPAKRSVRRDDDIDRPRRPRPRDEEYEDEDRPRRKKKYLVPLPAMIGGGVLLVALLVGGGLWAGGVFSSGKGTSKLKGNPPAGWTRIDDDDFSAFAPGTAGFENLIDTHTIEDDRFKRIGKWKCTSEDGDEFEIATMVYEGQQVGTTEAEMRKQALRAGNQAAFFFFGDRDDYNRKEMITMAGKPAMEVVTRERDSSAAFREARAKQKRPPPTPTGIAATDEHQRIVHENIERGFAETDRWQAAQLAEFLKKRKHYVGRVIVDGSRVFVLSAGGIGRPPNAEKVKKFFDSFTPN